MSSASGFDECVGLVSQIERQLPKTQLFRASVRAASNAEVVTECAFRPVAVARPYLTEHINRFGDYTLNLGRKPPQPDYGYILKQMASTY